MFRRTNPSNFLLRGSECFFNVEGLRSKPELSSEYLTEVSANGGTITTSCDQFSFNSLSLRIPHEKTDAFGGLFILAQLKKILVGVANIYGERSGTIGKFRYKHAWTTSLLIRSTQTITQKFYSNILDGGLIDDEETLGICVSMDDLANLDKTTLWGNSLVIVTYRASELKSLCTLSKAEWRSSLNQRATRTTNILQRKRPKALESRLLFSSLGMLEKYSWVPPLSPAHLAMMPTPISSRTANLVTWSYLGVHGLTLICDPEHQCLLGWEKLKLAWEKTYA